jgi:hypothetical protein
MTFVRKVQVMIGVKLDIPNVHDASVIVIGYSISYSAET